MGKGRRAKSWWEPGSSRFVVPGSKFAVGGWAHELRSFSFWPIQSTFGAMIWKSLIVLVCLTCASTAVAQSTGSDDPKARYTLFMREIERDGVYVQIAPGVAENLLIHKEEPVLKKAPMSARIMGTVVVAFEINKNGLIRHPMVISGPRMLQQAAIEAVRKYTYKPYILNGEAIPVGTHTSLHFDLQ
jgi:TonB family protein